MSGQRRQFTITHSESGSPGLGPFYSSALELPALPPDAQFSGVFSSSDVVGGSSPAFVISPEASADGTAWADYEDLEMGYTAVPANGAAWVIASDGNGLLPWAGLRYIRMKIEPGGITPADSWTVTLTISVAY